jgi:hypothetical protein
MDRALFDRLLCEGESSRLDYKREQYPLSTYEEKGELIKDILAMANSWRDSDAYILVGVEEITGQPAKVIGINQSADDATLQQLLKDKVNKPLSFRYSEFTVDGSLVAAIHIPAQARAFFLRKPFGKLLAATVYLRRGTSTVVADPDEVLAMGHAIAEKARTPVVEIEFADAKKRQPIGRDLKVSELALASMDEDDLPKIKEPTYGGPFGYANLDPTIGSPNPDYWIELHNYVQRMNATVAVGFVGRNRSAVAAHGVRIEFRLPCADTILIDDRPPRGPRKRLSPLDGINLTRPGDVPEVSVKRYGDTWHIQISLGKIQPGAEVWTKEELHLGTLNATRVVLQGNVFGDNFDPVPVELAVDSSPTMRDMTSDDLTNGLRVLLGSEEE